VTAHLNHQHQSSSIPSDSHKAVKKLLLIKPICSQTVCSGLKAWINAIDDACSSFSWAIDESQMAPSGHDLIITDVGHIEEARKWSRDTKIPFAVWGNPQNVPNSVPRLQLPVSANGFIEFTKQCGDVVTRIHAPREFSRPTSFPL
jgi:hypothetical protein